MINYYREAIKEHGLEARRNEAIRLGWKPALLCSVTTGIGLGSLYVSDIAPIAKFGVFSAIGVFLMLIMLFLLLPAALQMWPDPAWLPKKNEDDDEHHNRHFDPHAGTIWSESVWSAVSGFLIRHNMAVTIGCLLFISFVGYGVTMMHTSIDLLKLFDKQRQGAAGLSLAGAERRPPGADGSRDPLSQGHDPGERSRRPSRTRFPRPSRSSSGWKRSPGFRTRSKPKSGPKAATWSVRRWPLRPLPRRSPMAAIFSPSPAAPRPTPNSKPATRISPRAATSRPIRRMAAELWRVSLRAAAFRNLDYGLFVESVRSDRRAGARRPAVAADWCCGNW